MTTTLAVTTTTTTTTSDATTIAAPSTVTASPPARAVPCAEVLPAGGNEPERGRPGRDVQRVELHRCAVGPHSDWLLLRIVDADGVVGWGECSDAGPVQAVVRELAEWAQRPRDLGDLTRRTIAGALEQARLDQAARAAGRPLGARSAGGPESLELYADLGRAPGGRAPSGIAATAAAAVRAGFRAVQLAPFDSSGGDRLPDLAVMRVQAVRAAVGDDVAILVDCRERLSLKDLTPLLESFAELGVARLTDAVGIDRPDELALLRRRTGIPLAGGGFAHRVGQVERVAGLLDVLRPDVKHAGGPRAVLALAGATGAAVSLRNPSGPVATLHSARLAAELGCGPLEYAFGEAPWRAELTGGAELVRDGRLILPTGPGIGAEPDLRHPAVTRVWGGAVDLYRDPC